MTFDEWWRLEGHLLYSEAEVGHITWESVMNLAYVAGCEINLTLKTSEEWQKLCKAEVLDPDGWDRDPQNYQFSWYEELITRGEFERRLGSSTIQCSVADLGNIWKK